MALLRLQNEAECLTSQHTKQNLRDQPFADARSKLPLPRERFSPLADCGRRPISICKASLSSSFPPLFLGRDLKTSERGSLCVSRSSRHVPKWRSSIRRYVCAHSV